MIIAWILIAGLIVWGVIYLTRRGSSRGESGTNRSSLEVAKERYARGEINWEEFERIKKDLM